VSGERKGGEGKDGKCGEYYVEMDVWYDIEG